MLGFEGRRVLVTGGSRGVGAATCRLLARAGADVALTYHARRDAADHVADAVRGAGRRAAVLGGDHADPDTARRLVGDAAALLGGLDGLVVNHGVWPVADVPLSAMSDARWRDTLRTNLDGVFTITRAALTVMTDGAVVMVASTAGQRGEAFHADYAASKGAMISLVKSLAGEVAPRITVNGVAPGWIDTDMSAGVLHGEYRARVEAAIPLRRIATPDDVAGPIAFLLSPLARHVTGEILNVNGGSVLCG